MRKIFILLLIMTAVWATYCQGQQRYLDDLFTEIEKKTLTYASKDGQDLKLDIYSPREDSLTKRPFMVWMHGGGFAGGSRDNGDEVRLMKALARKGYVAVSISYRLLRKGKKTGFSCDCPREEKMRVFREAAADFMDACLYLKENAVKLGLDSDLMMIGGSSAGAEAILNAAYARDWLFDNPEYDSLQFSALLSLAGAVVDARYITEKNNIPALLFHGTDDNLVPYATAPHHYCKEEQKGYIWLDGSRTIAQRLEELGSSYLLYTFEGARHEISRIPFDQLGLIVKFLNEVAIEGKDKVLNIAE